MSSSLYELIAKYGDDSEKQREYENNEKPEKKEKNRSKITESEKEEENRKAALLMYGDFYYGQESNVFYDKMGNKID